FGGCDVSLVRAAVARADAEFVIEERDPHAVRRRARDEQAIFEMRLWVRAGEPIGELAIDHGHFLERELVDVRPLFAETRLLKEAAPFAHDPPWLVRRGLLSVVVEADRRSERRRAHPHVGEPALTVEFHAQEEVRPRRRFAASPLKSNARA